MLKKLFLALVLSLGFASQASADILSRAIDEKCTLDPFRGKITCLVQVIGDYMSPGKVPVVIVHGVNLETIFFAGPKLDTWKPFMEFYATDKALRECCDLFIFAYFSQMVTGEELGIKLGKDMDDLNLKDPYFGSRPIIFDVHSFGNDIARSFALKYVQRSGAWAGQLGKQRVAGIISQGGAMHGSPMANGPALYARIKLEDEFKLFLFENLFYYSPGVAPTWDYPNRSDLRWSNYDNLLDYDRFSKEPNLWIESLNADRSLDSRIYAYAGLFDPKQDCDTFDISNRAYCFGSGILKNIGLPSDGIVPVSSALFYDQNGKSRTNRTRVLDGYNHTEIVTGKGDGILFKSIKADWLEIASSVQASSSTITVNVVGGGKIESFPNGIDCGFQCSWSFPVGESVYLFPYNNNGYVFAGWNGNADCYDGLVNVQSYSITCTARFLPVLRQSRLSPKALDFDGDGRGDIFAYNSSTGQYDIHFSPDFGQFYFRSEYWSPGLQVFPANLDSDPVTDMFSYNPVTGEWIKAYNLYGTFYRYGGRWSPGWQVQVMDLNGDHLSDVFLYSPTTGQWFKCFNLGNSEDFEGGHFRYVSGAWSPGWQLHSADFNGDRLSDLLLYNPNSGQWFKALGDGGSGFNYETGVWSAGWQIYPADFNGDTWSDLLLYNYQTGQWFVATSASGGFTYYTGTWSPGWSIEVGDFDANGLADVFLYIPDRPDWFVLFGRSNANDFGYYSGTRNLIGSKFKVVDFNGDGYSDLIEYGPKFGTSMEWLNRGNGTFRLFTSFVFPDRELITSR